MAYILNSFKSCDLNVFPLSTEPSSGSKDIKNWICRKNYQALEISILFPLDIKSGLGRPLQEKRLAWGFIPFLTNNIFAKNLMPILAKHMEKGLILNEILLISTWTYNGNDLFKTILHLQFSYISLSCKISVDELSVVFKVKDINGTEHT